MPDAYVLREMIAAEQRDFADCLRRLTPADWETPSLCTGWSVHEAVIHITIHTHTRDLERFVKLVRLRNSDDRLHEPERARTPDELIAWLESPATLRPGNLLTQLSELLIHQQDVRRPLGATRVIPPERLSVGLDFAITRSGNLQLQTGCHRRAKGLRLVATDIGWSAGTGPEVSGPGEALFMALHGRADALTDLTGAGLDTLAARMP
jgi:uncharacterized protein (TIGR03083 family)